VHHPGGNDWCDEVGEDEGEVMFYTPITFDETNPFGWVDVIAVVDDDMTTCNEAMAYFDSGAFESARADVLGHPSHTDDAQYVL
jgi:hypothetical protein